MSQVTQSKQSTRLSADRPPSSSPSQRLTIRPYEAGDRPAIIDLSRRIADAGIQRDQASIDPPAQIEEDYLARPRMTQRFVASDAHGIHGGYGLRYDPFYCGSDSLQLAYYSYPISEGIIDRRYATVGLKLLLDAQKRQPLMYAIGAGGLDRPLSQLLLRSGWSAATIPFYFLVVRPSRFFRQVEIFRRSPARRWAGTALAFSGMGTVLLKSLQAIRSFSSRSIRAYYQPVEEFGTWAEQIQDECRGQYPLIANRDLDNLSELFPRDADGLTRLEILHQRRRCGWATVVEQIRGRNAQFGDLKVGLIADGLARTEDAPIVIRAAVDYLKSQAVDLIVCNFSHRAWKQAVLQHGFFSGPSNYPLMISTPLARRLESFPQMIEDSHFTRGDGDGVHSFLGKPSHV